jgi:hypothetical protein
MAGEESFELSIYVLQAIEVTRFMLDIGSQVNFQQSSVADSVHRSFSEVTQEMDQKFHGSDRPEEKSDEVNIYSSGVS